MGIGIDYSIHVISGFNTHLKENGDVEKALENTIMISGKAVIINATSVAAGFMVHIFSHMVPFQNFGLLIAISVFGSGLGALTLLPVIFDGKGDNVFANLKDYNMFMFKLKYSF
jgi:predicted RND superfamily exporter protein